MYIKLKEEVIGKINTKRGLTFLSFALDKTSLGIQRAIIKNEPNGPMTKFAALVAIKKLLGADSISELIEHVRREYSMAFDYDN